MASSAESLRDAAQIEIGLRRFLDEHGFEAFTDNFQTLHGLTQLPGVAAQRLMADGYGFGAEGDWKTAALVRAMKVMSAGLEGGTSFMEDYTYHFKNGGQYWARICWKSAPQSPLRSHLLRFILFPSAERMIRFAWCLPRGPVPHSWHQ